MKAQSQHEHMTEGLTFYQVDPKSGKETLIARDCKVELADLTNVTAEITALGKMKVASPIEFEDLVVKVTIPGHGDNVSLMTIAGDEEARFCVKWGNHYIDAKTRSKKMRGNRLYFYGDVTKVGGDKLEVGTITENEYEISCSFYHRMDSKGKTIDLIDRYLGVCWRDGKNLTKELEAVL